MNVSWSWSYTKVYLIEIVLSNSLQSEKHRTLTHIFKESGIIFQLWLHFPIINFANEYPVV